MTLTFTDLGLPEDLAASLRARGIDSPFPIQSATVADGLAGRDLCGSAPTGSGKTLAFAIPIAARVGKAAPGRPRALVLTPTRELANQVREALDPLLEVRGKRAATFVGGKNIKRDLHVLRGRIDVIVATPGRLEDLIARRACDLSDVGIVVIDEADRMADMGFLPVVKRLLDATHDDRQTLLFSATLDGDVDVLVRRYQRNPVRHVIEQDESERGQVRHLFWPTDRQDRRHVTAEIVRRVSPAIVFTRTKHGADRLARQLAQSGIEAAAIHGNRSQSQRERALRAFSNGSVAALVATDVAARGIHVDDVSSVVHFDVAGSDKDYVHRSGRTGRAGSTGVVVTLVTPEDHAAVDGIQRSLEFDRGVHTPDMDDLGVEGEAPAVVARPRHEADTPTRHNGSRSNGQRSRSGGGRRPSGSGGSGQSRSSRQRSSSSGGNGQGASSRNGGNSSRSRSGQGRNTRRSGGARPSGRR